MSEMIYSYVGLVHLLSAISSLVSGTVIILSVKGTRFHTRLGFLYLGSMIVLNATALLIYRLTGSINIFHVFALLSIFSIIGGMYFPIFKRQSRNWTVSHLEIMGWSVTGLYAAFAAEIAVRLLPQEFFWLTVLFSGGLITTAGGYLIRKRKYKELNALTHRAAP